MPQEPSSPGSGTEARPREAGQSRGSEARPSPGSARARDARIDVLRGIALLTIFIDHIPNNAPAMFTLHRLGFSDAAEIFVLLAGCSAMQAYGGLFRRAGVRATVRRIAWRCLRIYLFQAGLLLATLLIVSGWMSLTGLVPRFGVAPLLDMGLWPGLLRGLTLNALPNYLDILPLYIVLLAIFPMVYFGLRHSAWGTLALSAAVWLAANAEPRLNLPNAVADDGWYFNPFAWQFLFVIGAALTIALRAGGGLLPRHPVMTALAATYLAFAFVQAATWTAWGLPDLRPFAMEVPDKSHVPLLRLAHILALMAVLFASPAVLRLSASRWLRPLDACGRHSLEIFAAGCIAALVGRVLYRTFGPTWPLQVAVNLGGIALMLGLGLAIDAHARRRAAA